MSRKLTVWLLTSAVILSPKSLNIACNSFHKVNEYYYSVTALSRCTNEAIGLGNLWPISTKLE